MARGPGVVIGRKGSLGTVHFVDGDYWPHDTTLWSKDLRGNSAKFVYYFLKTLGLERYDVGNSNPTLNRNHIHKLPICFPDRGTQGGIELLLSVYDDLIANNKRRIELLDQSARLLYREWFVRLKYPGHGHDKVVYGVPEGWTLGRIADFYDTASGGTPSRKRPEFFSGDIPWVKTQELNGRFILDTEECITAEAVRNSAAKVFPQGTLIVAMYGATIGELGLLAIAAATNQACCAILPREGGPSTNFAYWHFREGRFVW